MDKNVLIELKDISKKYDDQLILDHINLCIHKNEFITLLGPSGCGKTTTLRVLGGFEVAESGKIMHQGDDISDIPPYKRNVNTVFQKFALFPHLNVYQNIAFGLRVKKMNQAEISKRVMKALKQVNLSGYENRSVNKLSGGQQQRVAIARAIVNEPEVLLLDEPLSSLDLKLRQEMQYELKTLQRELGITFVYVTHDQEEALTMSDTVVVMNNGIIQQMGNPEDIYNEPLNAFVAAFIGESNIYSGIMKEDKVLELFGHTMECVDGGFDENEEIDVVIRPEDIILKAENEGELVGTVTSCIFKGVHYETCLETYGKEWMIHNTKNYAIGEKKSIHVDPFDIHIMRKGEVFNET